MNKPQPLTAAQIARMAELTAKITAQVAARKAAHVHVATEPSAWVERCACGASRAVGGRWSRL